MGGFTGDLTRAPRHPPATRSWRSLRTRLVRRPLAPLPPSPRQRLDSFRTPPHSEDDHSGSRIQALRRLLLPGVRRCPRCKPTTGPRRRTPEKLAKSMRSRDARQRRTAGAGSAIATVERLREPLSCPPAPARPCTTRQFVPSGWTLPTHACATCTIRQRPRNLRALPRYAGPIGVFHRGSASGTAARSGPGRWVRAKPRVLQVPGRTPVLQVRAGTSARAAAA
jgi:hypothetical protein